jgi:putative phosphoesterase
VKIGIISDVHGNLKALKKVYQYFSTNKIDTLFFLGDVVGYYPEGHACFNFLTTHNFICLKGNHEAMMLLQQKNQHDVVYQLAKTKNDFSAHDIDMLDSWKDKLAIEFNGISLFMAHGGPQNFLNEKIYPDSDLSFFTALKEEFFFMGHTHWPFVKKVKSKTIINVGSVGLPRDVGNLGSFAIFDTTTKQIEIKRFIFDASFCKKVQESTEIHPSVKNLFLRNNKNYVGTLIN